MTKTAIVTGASRGIGLAVSKRLAASDFAVYGIARKFERDSRELFAQTWSLDLGDIGNLPDAFKRLGINALEPEVVIFCAGIGKFGSLEQMSNDDISTLVDLNLVSPMLLTRAVLPGMRRRGCGRLIYLGSEAAHRPGRKGSLYCASKSGLRGFVHALREDVAQSGVAVSIINPGMTATGFYDALDFAPGVEAGQHLEVETVADAVELVINANPGVVYDEINLSPANRVIDFRKKPTTR